MIPNERFIHQLSKMNLDANTDAVVLAVLTLLRQEILGNLQKKQQEVRNLLSTTVGPNQEDTDWTRFTEQTVEDQRIIERMISEIADIQPTQGSSNPTPPAPNWDTFNEQFASHFPNIELLIDTLSDAPDIIKRQLVPLSNLVLKRITDENAKKASLKNLKTESLQSLIEEAKKTYDELNIKVKDLKTEILSSKEDADTSTQTNQILAFEKEKTHCKSIVHSSLAEIVHRHCIDVGSPVLETYQQKLKTIMAYIPQVKNPASDILDDISDTQPSIQTDITQLLAQCTPKDSSVWTAEHGTKALEKTQEFYQTLQFGQKNLHGYMAETKKRLIKDLCFGEVVLESKLFPKDETLYAKMKEVEAINRLHREQTTIRIDKKEKLKMKAELDILLGKEDNVNADDIKTLLTNTPTVDYESYKSGNTAQKKAIINQIKKIYLINLHDITKQVNNLTENDPKWKKLDKVLLALNQVKQDLSFGLQIKAVPATGAADILNSRLPNQILITKTKHLKTTNGKTSYTYKVYFHNKAGERVIKEIQTAYDLAIPESYEPFEDQSSDNLSELICNLELVPKLKKPLWMIETTSKGTSFVVNKDRIKARFKSYLTQPEINLQPSQQNEQPINATLFAYRATKTTNQRTPLDVEIADKIVTTNEETFAKTIIPSGLLDEITIETFSANSIEQLKTTIENNQDLDQQYKTNFNQIHQNYFTNLDQNISSLQLTPDQETQFQQLLKLYQFKCFSKQPLLPSLIALQDSFTCILSDPKKALGQSELTTKIKNAYTEISKYIKNENEDNILTKIINDANNINQSNLRRETFSTQLQQALESPEGRQAAIIQIYSKEYDTPAVLQALGIKEGTLEHNQLHEDIISMATKFERLLSRTERGDPIIMPDENNAYFEVLAQIHTQLADQKLNINDVQFKLSHKLATGDQIFTIQGPDGKPIELDINLTTRLPYSLYKPKGTSDYKLSFGGTRGVVAPFAGLQEAYKREGEGVKHTFKNFMLVGEGQYAAVKAIQDFITHINAVMKKVYIPEAAAEQTFNKTALDNKETRRIFARSDVKYAVEADVWAARGLANPDKTQTTLSFKQKDKTRKKGAIFNKENPLQGFLIMDYAPGRSLAQISNDRFAKLDEASPEFHNPIPKLIRENTLLQNSNEQLAISTAILDEVASFDKNGITFSHNDIKPENFNLESRDDGTYKVSFTDWGTGGFKVVNTAAEKIPTPFQDLLDQATENGKEVKEPETGRFVIKNDDTYRYGIKPQLEILGGNYHCTLAYISPKVLDNPPPKGSFISEFEADNTILDDWALTATIFGICQTPGYLKLAKGRPVGDYAISGVLEAVDPIHDEALKDQGLKIADQDKFDALFGVPDENNGYNKAVMFIPSHRQEGEPLHLYRRLYQVAQTADKDRKKEIQDILNFVSNKVASGDGLTRKELTETVNTAKNILKALDKTAQIHESTEQVEKETKKTRLDKLLGNDFSTHINLAVNLEQLCTYPANADQIQAVRDKLQKIPTASLSSANCPNLLKKCITAKQGDILLQLIEILNESEPKALQQTIESQNLIQYALQEGMTNQAIALIEVFEKQKRTEVICNPGQPFDYLKWHTSALEIAIRGKDKDQLSILLRYIPSEYELNNTVQTPALISALKEAASLGYQDLFTTITDYFDLKPEQIFAMTNDGTSPSPYHLLLKNSQALNLLPWEFLRENKDAAKSFLLSPHPSTPCLLAAEAGNIEGLRQLIALGQTCQLDFQQWERVFALRDLDSKNIANHVLDTHHRDDLPDFIKTITTLSFSEQKKATLLKHLLFNHVPNDPVANELATSGKTDEANLQWLASLKEAIMPSASAPHSPDRQAVLVGLFEKNKTWLVAAGKKESNHRQLEQLLTPTDIHGELVSVLIESLKKAENDETGFYAGLLKHLNCTSSSFDHLIPHRDHFNFFMQDINQRTADVPLLMKMLSERHLLITRLRLEVSSSKQEVSTIRATLLNKEMQATSLQLTIETLNSNLEQKKDELTKINTSRAAENQQKSQSTKKLKKEIHKLNVESHDLQNQFNNTLASLSALKIELTESVTRYNDLSKQYTENQKENRESLLMAQADAESRNFPLMQSFSDVVSAKKELEISVATHLIHVEAIAQENNQLREALKTTSQELTNQRISYIELESKQAEQSSIFEAQRNKLELQVSTTREQYQSLSQTSQNYSTQLENKEKELQTLQTNSTQNSEAISKARKEIAFYKLQINSLVQKQEETAVANVAFQKQLQQLTQEKNNSTSAHQRAIHTMQENIDTLSNDRDVLQNKLNDALPKITEMEKQVETLKLQLQLTTETKTLSDKENTTLNTQLDRARELLTQQLLDSELAILGFEETILQLKNQVNKSTIQLEEISVKNHQLTHDFDNQKLALDHAEEELVTLKNAQLEKGQQSAAHQLLLNQKTQEIEDLQKKLIQFYNEQAIQNATIATSDIGLQKLQLQYITLQQQYILDKQEHSEQLDKQLSDTKDSLKTASELAEKAKQTLEDQVTTLKNELSTANISLDNSVAENEKLREEVNNGQVALEEANQRKLDLERQLESNLTTQKQNTTVLENQLKQQNAKILALETTSSEAQNKLITNAAELQKLESKLARMENHFERIFSIKSKSNVDLQQALVRSKQSLDDATKEFNQTKETLTKTIQEIQTEAQKTKQLMSEQEQQLQKVTNELEKSKQTGISNNQESEQRQQTLNFEIEASNKAIEELTAKNKHLETTNTSLKLLFQASEKDSTTERKKNATLLKKIQNIETTLNNTNQTATKLTGKLTLETNKNAVLSKQVEELIQKSSLLTLDLAKKNQQIVTLTDEKEQLTLTENERIQQLQTAVEHVQVLEKTIADILEQQTILKVTLNLAQKEGSLTSKQNQTLLLKLNSTNIALLQAKKTINTLEKKLKLANDTIATLTAQIQYLDESISKQKETTTNIQRQHEKTKKELKAAEQKTQELTKECTAIENELFLSHEANVELEQAQTIASELLENSFRSYNALNTKFNEEQAQLEQAKKEISELRSTETRSTQSLQKSNQKDRASEQALAKARRKLVALDRSMVDLNQNHNKTLAEHKHTRHLLDKRVNQQNSYIAELESKCAYLQRDLLNATRSKDVSTQTGLSFLQSQQQVNLQAIDRTLKASNSIFEEQKKFRSAFSQESSDSDLEVINPIYPYSYNDDTTSEEHSELEVLRPFFSSSKEKERRSKSESSHDDIHSLHHKKTTAKPSAAPVSAVLGRARTIEDVHQDIAVAINNDTTNYSNSISKDRKSVTLATKQEPHKKLLDAEIDKVKVFRRLIEDTRMTIEDRAKLILQSMGIPPRKDSGLELPEDLIINNKSSYAELETTLSKDGNEVMLEVAKEMFTQFETIKNTLGYDDDTSSISTLSNL